MFIELNLLYFISCIIFCLLIGSFLNMLIYRLPLMIFKEWQTECDHYLKEQKKTKKKPDTNVSLLKPSRSFCPKCNHTIAKKDNIPLISFILLKGKCRNCRKKIPLRYPLVELLTLIVGLSVFIRFDFDLLGLAVLFLSFILILIAFIDYEHMIIPDYLSYVGLWLGLLINISNYQIISIDLAIYGAICGYLLLWSIYWIFKLTTGKEGFGHGDFKLSALFGAWLGIFNIFPVLIIASITGTIVFMINHSLTESKSHINKPFAFGPYLAIAGWLVLLFPEYLDINHLFFLNLFA